MHAPRIPLALVGLTILAVSACGANPNKPPPGITAQQSLAAKGGLANQPGGTCKLYTTASIRIALGGEVGTPMPDTLTPGFDRCTWTITNSNLGGTVQLTAYRSTQRLASVNVNHNKNLVSEPQLGRNAVWAPATRTLTWPDKNGAMGLQAISTAHVKINPTKSRVALLALAKQHATAPMTPVSG